MNSPTRHPSRAHRFTAAFRRSFWRGVAAQSGVAATELALLTPVFVYLCIGALDYGVLGYRRLQVHDAAQAGALYAIRHGFDATAMSSVVTGVTSYSAISASPAPTQFCGCATATGIVTQATCGVTCVDGSSPGTYATASSAATYQTSFSYPYIPSSFSLSAVATVRLK